MENKFYFTVGLEIHAQLKTNTKMFCGCKNDSDEEKPNANICPVCMAHPGTLPVINKKAVENVIKVGLALNGKIADFTEFDRKNYFYPDIPKGFQISQYKYPIVSGGQLAGFHITRVHLEEDTANNKHDQGDYSLIDFNRAGVPLMELVTEPHTYEDVNEVSKKASGFAKELQLMLWCLRVSDANMEKGEMRVEANVSVSRDKNKLGTKVEIKNLNSFRSVEKAIVFELERMMKLLEDDKENEIIQETRGWDESKQKTFSQRRKESSHDYRYFPEPDLPKMKLHEAFDLDKIKKELPELPEAKRTRYKNDFELKAEDTEVFVNDLKLAEWFEEVVKKLDDNKKIKTASNYITSDLVGLQKINSEAKLPDAENFAELVNLILENKISSRVAKDILAMIAINDESPLKIATKKNLFQSSDEEMLKKVAEKIIKENPQAVTDYTNGKKNALMSLVGKIMQATKGSANPQVAKNLILSILNQKGQ